MTETLVYRYSSESTQRELSNEYQHDRVWMFFEKLCVLVLWVKVPSALEGFNPQLDTLLYILIPPCFKSLNYLEWHIPTVLYCFAAVNLKFKSLNEY